MSTNLEDRRSIDNREEEAIVAQALLSIERIARIILSRQGDVLERVLVEMRGGGIDIDRCCEDVSKTLHKLSKRIRRYK